MQQTMSHIMGNVMQRVANTPFIPLGLNPVLWLDANDASTITEVAGAVSQWDDKSGNGNHATQGTGSAQPTTGAETVGGKNALYFDGVDDFMAYDGTGLAGVNYTTFVAFKRKDDITPYIIGGGTNATNRNLHLAYALNTTFRFAQWANDVDVSVPAYVPDTPIVVSCGIRSTDRFVRYNGSEGTDPDTTQLIDYLNAYIGKLRTTVYKSVVAEVIHFDYELSTDEVTQVEAYLTAKWGA